MIIKSLSRKSNTGQLVNYVFKYVFKEQEKNITNPKLEKPDKSKFIIRHNIRSRSINGFKKEYKENEKFRIINRADSIRIFHTIISFSNKDKEHITDKTLKDIAKKFIEERGLNNMYAGTKHEDKDHIHIHILISGTQLNGRSSRVSKQKFHSIKLALQKYQLEKYPQLKHSLPEHGKSERLAKEAIVERVKTERQTDKQALVDCLDKAYSNSKSQEQFISLITKSGHTPYYRNGSFQGIKYEGKMKFRLTNLGFDKAKLHVLNQIKANQDKALGELKSLRAGKSKDQKRSISQPTISKHTLDRNDKQLQELSAIRESNESKEIGGGDTSENRSIATANDEFKNREEEQDESKEIEDEENRDDDLSPEME